MKAACVDSEKPNDRSPHGAEMPNKGTLHDCRKPKHKQPARALKSQTKAGGAAGETPNEGSLRNH